MAGPFSALMTAIGDISGMDGLTGGNMWFGRIPDRVVQPPGCLITDPQGRDPLIQDAEFEEPQVYWFCPTVEFWTNTLANAEAWMLLMDDRFAFGSLAVSGYSEMQEGIEIGRVRFSQEKMTDTNVSLIHMCSYPMRIPLMKG